MGELVVSPKGDILNNNELEYYSPDLHGQVEIIRIDMKQIPYPGSEH